MVSCLRRIAEEINKRVNFKLDLPHQYELVTLLNVIEPEEKILIKRYFQSLDWNIGSTNVLALLQKCGILSATEYILTQEDYEHIQLVLNDFLETKFALLFDILLNCNYDFINSVKLTTILEECLKRLFSDLIANPDAIDVVYFSELKKLKLQDEIIRMFKQMHIDALLQLDKLSIKNAIKNLNKWRDEFKNDNNFYKLLCEVANNNSDILHYLLKKSIEFNFQGWKYYVLYIQILVDNCTDDDALEIKKHLKQLFKQFVREKNEKIFYITLLTARTIYSMNKSNLDTYQQWFKATFGEMTYIINPQEFKYVMGILSKSLALELESSFLEIQQNVAISAPPLCNQLVLSFKKICRQRIAALKQDDLEQSFDIEESIIIDD